MMKAFDAPSREEHPQRPQSNTPLAALVLLNDPTFLKAAKAFADKIVSKGGDSSRTACPTLSNRLSLPHASERNTLAALIEDRNSESPEN